MNKEVNFEIAKLLKEKGFDKSTLCFYTKPNSKMFGIDEHGRYYQIRNKAKSLWITGNAATLNIDNVYFAPTIAEVVMWLYEKHGIWISVTKDWDVGKCLGFESIIDTNDGFINTETYNSPTEAYEAAITYCLENLIQGGNNEQQ